MSTPTKFRPSPMMPLGKPTHTNACGKTLAPADSDSQKTGDAARAVPSAGATESETPETPTHPGPGHELALKTGLNYMIIKANSEMTQYWVKKDPVPQSSQIGAKQRQKLGPKGGSAPPAVVPGSELTPPLISPTSAFWPNIT